MISAVDKGTRPPSKSESIKQIVDSLKSILQ